MNTSGGAVGLLTTASVVTALAALRVTCNSHCSGYQLKAKLRAKFLAIQTTPHASLSFRVTTLFKKDFPYFSITKQMKIMTYRHNIFF